MTANDVVAKVKHLAPISQAAVGLIGMLDQPNACNDDIVNVLKIDNVLTAKLLRACNSSYFGLADTVASIDQAVLWLGHQQILHMALSLAFSHSMSALVKDQVQDARELWRHSLITGLAAECLVKATDSIELDPGVAFTAGLLHDLGKVVLRNILTPEFQVAIRDQIERQDLSEPEAERAVLGVDHAEVGKCLLASWHLPAGILEAVEHHHHPVTRPKPALSSVVHAADQLAYLVDANLDWETFARQTDPEVVEAFALDRQKTENLMIAAHDSMSQVENLMKWV
jgi:putative nucleotidyltransferase with HDIG domain